MSFLHPWLTPKTSKRYDPRDCTCDIGERPWPCAHRYAYSECERVHSRRLYLAVAAVIAVMITICALSVASAHDHANWINQGGYRNQQSGEFCCGEGDCFTVPKQMMGMDGKGYIIRFQGNGPSFNEHIPFAEAMPSKDGEFWRCKKPDGSRRCFFAPPPAM